LWNGGEKRNAKSILVHNRVFANSLGERGRKRRERCNCVLFAHLTRIVRTLRQKKEKKSPGGERRKKKRKEGAHAFLVANHLITPCQQPNELTKERNKKKRRTFSHPSA